MSELKKLLGRRVQELRKARKIKQEELAEMKEFWKRILQIRGVLAENKQLSF